MEIFKQQQWHLIILIALVFLFYNYPFIDSDILQGNLWNISTLHWFYITIAVPIVHQIYVLVCWRLELYHQTISKNFPDFGFTLYKIGFALLILLRPVSLVLLAISNKNTFVLNSTTTVIILTCLFIPSAYLFYSVKKYFGINRAFGEDHFNPEKYRNQKMIKKGIFKYTSNGMYIYGFLALYIPAILWHSKAALIVAVFNHIYIWVHYYFTELPDMKEIYNVKK